jgi:hypothetical protein
MQAANVKALKRGNNISIRGCFVQYIFRYKSDSRSKKLLVYHVCSAAGLMTMQTALWSQFQIIY